MTRAKWPLYFVDRNREFAPLRLACSPFMPHHNKTNKKTTCLSIKENTCARNAKQ